jgi:hypothetical protein
VKHSAFIETHDFVETCERERFEAQEQCNLARNSNGSYTPGVQMRWGGWRACAIARAEHYGAKVIYE